MTELSLNTSTISIPTSITAAAFFVSSFVGQNQLPSEYYPLPQFGSKNNIWEDQYLPKIRYESDSDKIEIIHNFASSLLNDSEDIPAEFAKIIHEDFWEIL
jgi:hypothetical protein